MKKIFNKNQLEELKSYPSEVVGAIYGVISMLDDNYGIRETEVEANESLGGYVLIVDDLEDVMNIKSEILNGCLAEYIDVIECSEGGKYTSSLFLVSDDYSIVVVVSEEFSKFLLEE